MLNPQAYSTNSMSELSSIMSGAIETVDETQNGKSKKRSKNKSEVVVTFHTLGIGKRPPLMVLNLVQNSINI